MQAYRRFVSYVYQYENGKKSGNRGFIKVEARGNTCSMQISLKGICKDENATCSVYGFKREDGLLKGSLLADCPVRTGIVQEQLVFARNEMGRAKYGLQELSGVIFQGDDQTMYGTQWDDDPMKMENFQPDEKNNIIQNSGNEPVMEETGYGQGWAEPRPGEWMTDGEIPADSGQPESGETEMEHPDVEYIPEEMAEQPAEGGAAENVKVGENPERGMPAEALQGGMAEQVVPEGVSPRATDGNGMPRDMPLEVSAGNEMHEGMPVGGQTGNRMCEDMPAGEQAGNGMREDMPAGIPAENGISGNMTSVEAVKNDMHTGVPAEGFTENSAPMDISADRFRGNDMLIAAMPEQSAESGIPDEVRAERTSENDGVPEALSDSVQDSVMSTDISPERTAGNVILENMQPEGMPGGTVPVNAQPGNMPDKLPTEVPEDGISAEESPESGVTLEIKETGSAVSETGECLEAESIDEMDSEEKLTDILDTTVPVPDFTKQEVESSGPVENAPGQENYIELEPQEDKASKEKNFCPFSDGILEDCRKIKIGDLKFLDSRDQSLRNNRFVQHGYQMFGHLLLARIARNGQYILGVPGMYQQQEKFMADMFGFHNFKYAKRGGPRQSGFGYWYRLIYPPKPGRGNGRAK